MQGLWGFPFLWIRTLNSRGFYKGILGCRLFSSRVLANLGLGVEGFARDFYKGILGCRLFSSKLANLGLGVEGFARDFYKGILGCRLFSSRVFSKSWV